MRKLYWWCLGGGVLLLAGVFTSAQIAAAYPHSLVGRALFSASQLAVYFNPVGGLGHADDTCCPDRRSEPAADEGPAELCEPDSAAGQPPASEPAPEGAITISEEEPIPPAEMPVGPEESCPVQAWDPEVVGPDCPPSDRAGAAPLTMPYCEEEACEPPCDRLHMPTAEADGEEEQEEADEPRPTGGAHRMLRLLEKLLKRDAGG